MRRFFAKPYVYAACFSLALTLLFAWSLLTVFVIPREMEPSEELETIDFSQFTKPDGAATESEPVFILTLPSDETDREPAEDETDPDSSAEESATESAPEYPIITENSYLDENISITIKTIRRYGSTFHVAEIKLSDPQYLKTALAKDTYGLNIKEKTSEQAKRVGAILAINGDYYGANEKGYVIRNGHIYRRTLRPTDDKRRKYFEDLAILWDGSFFPFDEQTNRHQRSGLHGRHAGLRLRSHPHQERGDRGGCRHRGGCLQPQWKPPYRHGLPGGVPLPVRGGRRSHRREQGSHPFGAGAGLAEPGR